MYDLPVLINPNSVGHYKENIYVFSAEVLVVLQFYHLSKPKGGLNSFFVTVVCDQVLTWNLDLYTKEIPIAANSSTTVTNGTDDCRIRVWYWYHQHYYS